MKSLDSKTPRQQQQARRCARRHDAQRAHVHRVLDGVVSHLVLFELGQFVNDGHRLKGFPDELVRLGGGHVCNGGRVECPAFLRRGGGAVALFFKAPRSKLQAWFQQRWGEGGGRGGLAPGSGEWSAAALIILGADRPSCHIPFRSPYPAGHVQLGTLSQL
jgi:hypothetical protein